jgi:hypothetical protein
VSRMRAASAPRDLSCGGPVQKQSQIRPSFSHDLRERSLITGMRTDFAGPRLYKHSARQAALWFESTERYSSQGGHNLRLPFITSGIGIFGIDLLHRVNGSGIDFFKAVGFFPDMFDLVYPHVSPLQQADGLLLAGLAVCISTFRLRIGIFVFPDHVAVGFHARRLSVAVMSGRSDAITFS